jgi:hypothetical protein
VRANDKWFAKPNKWRSKGSIFPDQWLSSILPPEKKKKDRIKKRDKELREIIQSTATIQGT